MIVVYIAFEVKKQCRFTFFSLLNHDTVYSNIENGGGYEAQIGNIPLAASSILTFHINHQTICKQQPTKFWVCFFHFVGLALNSFMTEAVII